MFGVALLRRYRRNVLKGIAIALYGYFFLRSFFNNFTNPRIRETMPDFGPNPRLPVTNDSESNICYADLNILGPIDVNISEVELEKVEAENSHVIQGGSWSPSDCKPWQLVAILIPYRDRWEHLKVLLRRLHPMLQKQRISYQIFLIEQNGDGPYNKGILYNVGVKQALKAQRFDCFIFHDVDLLPENDKNIYYCDDHVRHFSLAIDEWRYSLLYTNNAGGVVALSHDNVVRVNGYSNSYWGWGAEDDDFSARTMANGLLINRPPPYIARYKMIRHAKSKRGKLAYPMLASWESRWKTDGLNSVENTNYTILKLDKTALFTRVLVDVGKAPKEEMIVLPTPSSHTLIWFYEFFFV